MPGRSTRPKTLRLAIMKMEETAEPEIYDEPLDEPVLEKLDQISKKLDALNKCSVSTVQMAKKVYAGIVLITAGYFSALIAGDLLGALILTLVETIL